MRSAECGMEGRPSIPHSEFRIPHWSGGVVRLDEFRSLVARLPSEIPSEFTGGVVAVDGSPQAPPHPVDRHAYTLGERVPLERSGTPQYLPVEGLVHPPPGSAILVVTPAPRLLHLFRRRPAAVKGVVEVTPLDG